MWHQTFLDFSDNAMNGILDLISVKGSNNNMFDYLGMIKQSARGTMIQIRW